MAIYQDRVCGIKGAVTGRDIEPYLGIWYEIAELIIYLYHESIGKLRAYGTGLSVIAGDDYDVVRSTGFSDHCEGDLYDTHAADLGCDLVYAGRGSQSEIGLGPAAGVRENRAHDIQRAAAYCHIEPHNCIRNHVPERILHFYDERIRQLSTHRTALTIA